MVRKILRRSHHGIALRFAEGKCDHILRYQAGDPYSHIEAFRNDVDQPAIGDDIHLHLRIAVQKLQHDPGEKRPGGKRRRIDAQDARRGFAAGTDNLKGLMNALQRRTDVIDKQATGVGEPHAAGSPVK